MKSYALTQVPSPVLLRELSALVAKDRLNTADLLAHLGEVEARRLYAPASCSSMHVYCVKVLRLSEDAAIKRLRVARMARRYPAIFPAIADGRLTLTAVLMLRRYIVPANAARLLALAEGRTTAELAEALAAEFPEADVPTKLEPLAPAGAASLAASVDRAAIAAGPASAVPGPMAAPPNVECAELVAARPNVEPAELLAVRPPVGATELPAPAVGGAMHGPSFTTTAPAHAPASSAPAPSDRARVAPLSADRFALQVTISRTTREKIVRAQELLGFSIRPGDVAELLDRALDLLVAKLEARKRGLTTRPRKATRRPSKLSRHVTSEDLRFIEKRDGGQCTYVGADGRRCEARFALEPHHVESFAKGGPTTRDNLFLRCPTHNQLAAEEEFGPEHVHRKRDQRRARVARERAERQAREARRTREVTKALTEPPPLRPAATAEARATSEAADARARSEAEAAAAQARRDIDALLAGAEPAGGSE